MAGGKLLENRWFSFCIIHVTDFNNVIFSVLDIIWAIRALVAL